MKAGQFGLVNIDLGSSADPALENRILEDVGSYGRQLGRIGDALGVLLNHLDTADFTPAEHEIIADLRLQLAGVERLKRKARKSEAIPADGGAAHHVP